MAEAAQKDSAPSKEKKDVKSEPKALVVQDASGTTVDPKTEAKHTAAEAAIKRFTAGVDLNQWYIDHTKKPVKRELTMFYAPPPKPIVPEAKEVKGKLRPTPTDLGSLFWVERKQKGSADLSSASKSQHDMPIDSLHDCYFGKRIQIFNAMAAGSEGAAIMGNRCFSLVSSAATFSGEALDAEDAWALANLIIHVSSLAQKKIKYNRGPAGRGEDAHPGGGAAGLGTTLLCITLKTRTVFLVDDPRDAPDYVIDKPRLLEHDSVRVLTGSGVALSLYEMGPNRVARKRNMILYYDLSLDPLGALVCTIPEIHARVKDSLPKSAPPAPAPATSASASTASTEAGPAAAAPSKDQPAADEKAAAAASAPTITAKDLAARPDTVVLRVDEITRLILGKQSQLLQLPVAQGAAEEKCVALMANKTLVGEVADAKHVAVLLNALRHWMPFNKKEVVQEKLKDAFQPLRKCFAVQAKQPPKDSDDEAGEDEDDGGDGF